jgi:hypothetical protein
MKSFSGLKVPFRCRMFEWVLSLLLFHTFSFKEKQVNIVWFIPSDAVILENM